MSQPPGPTPRISRFRLRTFGTAALTGAEGQTIIGEHGQQHRRLALLAVLAAAGDRGRTRDQLLLLFWPDASQSRARHSLEQLIYALRSSVADDIFSGSNPLRLNGEVLASDVAEFNEAVASGDSEGAVRQYSGPFLDGFYLSDAPEFEQWLDSERRRLERSYAGALEQLAEKAGSAADHAGAAGWWRKLAEVDPVSSKAAAGVMRAMVNAGDDAAALRYAEQYERGVTRELGVAAGPVIAKLAAEIRARSRSQQLVSHRPTEAPGETGAAGIVQAEIAPTANAQQPPSPGVQQSETSAVGSPGKAGPALDEAAERQRRPPRRAGVYLLAATAAVALVWLASMLWSKAGPSGAAKADAVGRSAVSSLAVLPFANLSGGADDAVIVDGLTEELIGALARVEGLRVVARTSAFTFRESDLDVRRIADSLRVSNVLEGAVQKAGQRLRVQVRLVDARDGTTRWSQTYDRELRDIFAVQSDIAAAVASELDLRLGTRAAQAIRRGSTQNVAAYELYLRGRDPVHFRTDSGPLQGLKYLQQAIALDSMFAAAYANMTYMYVRADGRGLGNPHSAELGRRTAEKALQLDPNLPEAHAALGVYHLGRSDLRSAEAVFKRSIALPGYTRAREHLANVYLWTGRPAEALTENLKAVDIDPLSPTAVADLGRTLCLNGRADEGLAQLARVSDLRPPLQRVPGIYMLCYLMKGAWQEAIDYTRRTGSRPNAYLGYALARGGRPEEARTMRAALIEQWQHDSTGAFPIAVISAGLRDYDAALRWLERSAEEPVTSYLGRAPTREIMYPLFADLHADPRFEQFRRRHFQRLGYFPQEP